MAASDMEQGAFSWDPDTASAGRRRPVAPTPVKGRVQEAGPKASASGRGRKISAELAHRRPAVEASLPPDNELWDVRAAARFLKRSVSWIYHRSEDGTLPVKRLGGWGLRFVPGELRDWVETGEVAKRR